MYTFFLSLHSAARWLVLAALVVNVINAFYGWNRKCPFTRKDNLIMVLMLSSVYLQLAIGVTLYFLSPIASYFLNHFSEAVHNRGQRFFGMEHSTMMVIAVLVITCGSIVAKRRTADEAKFKAMAIWYTGALVVIFFSIPWPFSPFTARPWLRW